MMSVWFLAAVGLAVVLTGFALWRVSGRLSRVVLVGLLLAFAGLSFAGTADLMGRPRPDRLEILRPKEAVVLWARIRADVEIRLLLEIPGRVEPLYYVLPWDRDTAQSLQDAIRDAEKGDRGPLTMLRPFERSWDKREPRFYAAPQPKLPDKPVPDAPLEYRRPGTDA